MFGLMLKSNHKAILQEAEDRVSYWHATYNSANGKITELKDEITQDNAKIIELHNALADVKVNNSKLRQLTKMQDESLDRLNAKLLNAVEGLSDKDKRILRERAKGNYIYTVKMDDGERNINVPMTASNFGDYAKRKFLKYFGLSREHIKNCTVERWEV